MVGNHRDSTVIVLCQQEAFQKLRVLRVAGVLPVVGADPGRAAGAVVPGAEQRPARGPGDVLRRHADRPHVLDPQARRGEARALLQLCDIHAAYVSPTVICVQVDGSQCGRVNASSLALTAHTTEVPLVCSGRSLQGAVPALMTNLHVGRAG